MRCADTFSFALLNDKELEKSAKRMLAQGYAYNGLAGQIGEAAYKVTEDQVAQVVRQVGTKREVLSG